MMTTKEIVLNQLQVIVDDLNKLHVRIDGVPSTHDVAIDNIHQIVTGLVNTAFDVARIIEQMNKLK